MDGETPKKSGRGGKREPGPGKRIGRPPKVLGQLKNEAEVLGLIWQRLPQVLDALVSAAEEGDVPAAKYLFDRVMGRPRQLGDETPEATARRLELELSILQKTNAIRGLELEALEKQKGSGHTFGRLEGRPAPQGGPGVGPCGIYHAALDPDLYPDSDLARLATPDATCPICKRLPYTPQVAP